jgi:hypothetical protein
MSLVSAVIAVVLFCLKAFGVEWESVDILALGLAFLALAVVLGALPFPAIQFNRERK